MNFLESPYFDLGADWIELLFAHQGIYAPLLLLVIEEMGVPLPIPGDFVIAYTGYQISKGTISYPIAYIILLVSILIGSSILFLISARYGQPLVLKFGRYIHLNEQSLKTVEKQFSKYGSWVIIFGRHLPWIRVPITVFAGMSGISYKKFLTCTFISAVLWIPLFLYLGQRLGIQTIQIFRHHPWYSIISSFTFLLIISLIFRILIKNNEKKTTH